MFNFNLLDRPEPFKFYLCRPNEDIICELNGIDEKTASMKVNFNNQFELSFDYQRFVSLDGELIESNGYHELSVGMKILVDKIGFFVLKYPPYKSNGTSELKSIIASSVECELEDKELVDFKVNMGVKDSLEYLVEYEDGETEELIDAYTGLPYDYIMFNNNYPELLGKLLNKYQDGTVTEKSAIDEIVSFCKKIPRLKSKIRTGSKGKVKLTEYVTYTYKTNQAEVGSILLQGFNERIAELILFYDKYHDQLSLINLAIEKCGSNWKVGKVDKSLSEKKYQFSVSENIYSFLTNTVASTARCVFSFDLFKRIINVDLLENIGKDSGVTIDHHTLLNSLNATCNDHSIYTAFRVKDGDNNGIASVNYGEDTLIDLSYFMNARNLRGKRIYVSDDLAEKYAQYMEDRDVLRDGYIFLTKEYNRTLSEIDKIKYKVPNDGVKNNWDTFSDKELEKHLEQYNKLLFSLQTLYKEDYGTVGCNSNGSINESYIKNTEYWHDYYAYKIIIEQITTTIKERSKGGKYSAISDKEILKKIHAYKTEWNLYGTAELENKIVAYDNGLKVLVGKESVILNSDKTAKTWNELTKEQKKEYGNLESNYQYEAYTKLFNERGSCQTFLDSLKKKLDSMEQQRDRAKYNRNNLAKYIRLQTYDRKELEKLLPLKPSLVEPITDDDRKVITSLLIEKEYSNPNITYTTLDTLVTKVDVQKELFEDSRKQLSIESQPQISFEADIDNLFCMPDFKDFQFKIGNYVYVEYFDEYLVKLRLYSIEFNPCIPEDKLSVTFTNYTKSNSERSDVSYIFNQSKGSGSSHGGSSGGGRAGNLGDGIDITLSNTLLSKLLNTESFGTRINNIILDTIKVNEITAKYAKFEGLSKGTTVIDGKCLQTGYIIDNLYDGVNGNIANSRGTVINLETGKFSFGGGKLKFDGTLLSIEGAIKADSGYIGGKQGFVVTEGKLFSNGHSAFDSNVEGVYIGTDRIALGQNGKTWFKKDGTFSLGSGKIVFDGNNVRFGDGVKLSWGSLPDGVVNRTDVTTITRNTISTEHIYASNLYVNAANINGVLQAHQINASSIRVNAANIDGLISGRQINVNELTSDSGRANHFYSQSVDSLHINSMTCIGEALNFQVGSITNLNVSGNLNVGGTNIASEIIGAKASISSLHNIVSNLQTRVARLERKVK